MVVSGSALVGLGVRGRPTARGVREAGPADPCCDDQAAGISRDR